MKFIPSFEALPLSGVQLGYPQVTLSREDNEIGKWIKLLIGFGWTLNIPFRQMLDSWLKAMCFFTWQKISQRASQFQISVGHLEIYSPGTDHKPSMRKPWTPKIHQRLGYMDGSPRLKGNCATWAGCWSYQWSCNRSPTKTPCNSWTKKENMHIHIDTDMQKCCIYVCAVYDMYVYIYIFVRKYFVYTNMIAISLLQ